MIGILLHALHHQLLASIQILLRILDVLVSKLLLLLKHLLVLLLHLLLGLLLILCIIIRIWQYLLLLHYIHRVFLWQYIFKVLLSALLVSDDELH